MVEAKHPHASSFFVDAKDYMMKIAYYLPEFKSQYEPFVDLKRPIWKLLPGGDGFTNVGTPTLSDSSVLLMLGDVAKLLFEVSQGRIRHFSRVG
ncbi:hypothetical protein BH11ARM2_BH11ARM2_33490 [soil metagenome]